MRLTIIGGSHGTGALLAAAARDAGHVVTAVSRSGSAPEGVRPIAGSASDPDVARAAVDGADAVVVTVGGARDRTRQRTEVTVAVIEAMRQAGVRRLVVQSSLGAGDSKRQLPALLRPVVLAALAKPLKDHNGQEAAVTASGLDWTIVRPSGLSTRPPTGVWRALASTAPGTLGGSISRADLAAFLLATLGDDATIGAAIGISS